MPGSVRSVDEMRWVPVLECQRYRESSDIYDVILSYYYVWSRD